LRPSTGSNRSVGVLRRSDKTVLNLVQLDSSDRRGLCTFAINPVRVPIVRHQSSRVTENKAAIDKAQKAADDVTKLEAQHWQQANNLFATTTALKALEQRLDELKAATDLNKVLDGIKPFYVGRMDSGPLVPVGAILTWAGVTAPDNFALCDGRQMDRTAYPQLYSVIQNIYGSSGNFFKLPDLKGRVVVARDQGNLSLSAEIVQVDELLVPLVPGNNDTPFGSPTPCSLSRRPPVTATTSVTRMWRTGVTWVSGDRTCPAALSGTSPLVLRRARLVSSRPSTLVEIVRTTICHRTSF